MSNSELLESLVGKIVLVKTHWGLGTKDASLLAGDYKGVLLGFDESFIQVEYEINKYENGTNVISKDIILINMSCILTIGEFREKSGLPYR